MKRKFIFSLLVTSLMTMSAWAETTTSTINPAWEANYRTNNANPTGWTKVTTTDAQFEIYNGACFFAVQTWQIADINHVTNLKFVYPRVDGQSNNGDVSLWVFPYNSMVTSAANYNTQGVAFLNDVQTVLGVMPGNTITNAPLLTSSVESINGKHCRVFNIDSDNLKKLIAAGNIDNNTLSVNILLNTKDAASNYKYYHTASGETPASYCDVTTSDEVVVPAIRNKSTWTGYSDLATAVAEATAGDVLIINEDVTISGSRVEIKKALTIQGATGEERIICGVPANQLMILANDNTANYDVVLKDLVIDGQNTLRSTQIFDANNKGRFVFENVSVVNSAYSVVTGDVKSNNREVVLKGNNSFSTGIYLNMNKRVSNQNTTHTVAIPLILANDYTENYAIVTTCDNADLYSAVGANGKAWELYVAQSGSNKELKGRVVAHSYDLTVSAAGYASLYLPFAAKVPEGVEVFTGNYNATESTLTLNPVEGTVLPKNTAVVVKAAEETYTFNEVADVAAIEGNDLLGVLAATAVSALEDTNQKALTLGLNAGQVGFYLPAGGTIGANKIYLLVAAAAAPVRIVEGSTVATSIENNAEAVKATKVMIDGAIYTICDNRMYDMLGRLVK